MLITRRHTLVMGAAAALQPVRTAFAADALRIGVLVPLTGTLASDGNRLLRAHQLAAKQINAQGGIKELGGAQVELVVSDIQSKPEVARSEAQRLISNENVSALVGAWASATTIPSCQVAERNSTPYVVTSAITDGITEQGMQYVFRVAPKGKWFSEYTADFIDYLRSLGLKISRFALATEDGPFGQTMRTNYPPAMSKRGLELVADETFKTGSPDLGTAVSKLKASNADVVLTACYSDDSAVLLRTMTAQRFRPIYIGYGGGHVTQTVLSTGKPAEGSYGIVEWNTDLNKAPSLEFVKQFAAEYPGESLLSNQPQAYTAIYALALAAAAAKSRDRTAIRDALRTLKVTSGPATILPLNELAFDAQGQAKAGGVMVQVQDNKFVTVWPKNYASSAPRLS